MSVEGRNEEATWDKWRVKHQPFELNYWKNTGLDWSADDKQFQDWWWDILEWTGIEDVKNTNMLDIGCGVRPPLKLVTDKLTVIEPLADGYQEIAKKGWWDGITVKAQPAEEYLDGLKESFDVVLCWNCLDHTVEYDRILGNIARYAKKDALIAVSTDFHPPGVGHPGYKEEDFMAVLGKHFDIVKERNGYKDRDRAFVLKKK